MGFSNCPVCLVGVVETLGYVELKEGPLEFQYGRLPLTKKATIIIGMCSRGPCQYVGMGAVPESPTVAKRILRDLILSLEKKTVKAITQFRAHESSTNDSTITSS
ncbi:hypothetical protein [Paenibacillus agricola]|uniref:Uncharacterized protein n=1 Tax=Paenibacillus agricola TaxID=2716264 RepID=A0ABX0JEH5_9BACL|nr:hypothetical protein [Paenibacillus agricola]NHN34940.1 hypothetical protein [Paenibacillus agricola]